MKSPLMSGMNGMQEIEGDDRDHRKGYLQLKSVSWDRVTGLPVFPVLFDALRTALDQRRHLGVIQVEPVNLELIESLYGWQVFDRVLEHVAVTLRQSVGRDLPASTLLAQHRVAGDRLLAFVLERPDGGEVDAATLRHMGEAVAARLGAAFGEGEFKSLSPELLFRTGQARIFQDPFYRFERQIYSAIDQAAQSIEQRESRRERSWGEELQKIIREAEIDSVLQPVVSLASGEVIGYEAFARGPKESLFERPQTMFALSGRMGVDAELDRLCLMAALRTSATSDHEGKLFANVLPTAADAFATGANLEELVRTHAVDPSMVVLELKERAADKHPERFFASLDRFRDLGFEIAIDDVGTGYGTRDVIERAKPDYVKLDESLVRGVHQNLIKKELLHSLVDLAGAQGAKVIAECVESAAEASALGAAGADYAQGYWFAAPALPQPGLPPRSES